MARSGLAVVTLGLVGIAAVGCDWPGKTTTAVPPVTPVSSLKRELPVPLQVMPSTLRLEPGDWGAQLLVDDRPDPSGAARDATGRAEWMAEPAGIVTVEGGYVRPIVPGKAVIRATVGGRVGVSEVTVSGVAERPWDVAADIVPILTRAGCNTGGCHGRAEGQNGFHLSLFGYDPAGDYQEITRRDGGRRLSLVAPEVSLLLLKATGVVPHVGGPRLLPGSTEYVTIRDWIRAGAPEARGKALGSLTAIRVEPSDLRLDEPGTQQVRVVARYAEGAERDVTRLALYKTNDDSAARVDARGLVVLERRAETDLIVRYGSQVVSARVAAVINPGLSYDFAARRRANFIDDALFRRLESLHVPPSPPASDAAFLRRVTLDLTGQQPSPDRVREYLSETDPDKRTKLVDRLLKDRDFDRFWQIKLGDLLEITSLRPEIGQNAGLYEAWLLARIRENAPWDRVVRDLLTTLGDPAARETAAASYAFEGADPKIQAEKTAQRFLGLRIRCAQCHDHPFDVWTQDDYFGLAATFAKVERSGGAGPAMMARSKVQINPAGLLEHLRTRQPARPRLLSGQPIEVGPQDDARRPLADWITSPENPYFARAMANWTWAQFFGKGIVDPPDDLSRSNPPVHPELLNALAAHFVAHKFDLRDLIRTIATSEAYAMSSASVPGNAADSRLFSHQMPRPLTAHQMADAIAQVTDIPNRFRDRPAGTRAIEVVDPATPSTILDTFGRCGRRNGCSSVPTPSLSLRQSLLLIGGDVIESKVANLNGYLANLLDLKPSVDEVVENLYFRTLCRPPSAEELSRWSVELKGAASLREAAEDLFWSLLNAREFAFNH